MSNNKTLSIYDQQASYKATTEPLCLHVTRDWKKGGLCEVVIEADRRGQLSKRGPANV